MTDQRPPRQSAVQPHERDDQRAIIRPLERRLTSPAWLARAAGVGLSSTAVGFVLLFLLVLTNSGELALVTRPLPMQVALALPYLVVALTVGAVLGALLGWWNRYWSLSARVHQTILALLGLGFSWQLATLGFLPL